MTAYYNEIDPFAAEWLRQLISAGHIAPGDVDTRSIVDVRPDDLKGYTQCHFFAGIGVWSYALRLAGWPDDRPVWTGSCPCQPFSAAGKGGGFDDERHLWPHFHWLIENCGPSVVLGEQVASKDGLAWLDLVQADLEGTGYASGAVDTCAAGFGAPHIRQRLYWLAYSAHEQHGRAGIGRPGWRPEHSDGRSTGGLADADGWNSCAERQQRGGEQRQQQENGRSGRLADANDARLEGRIGTEERPDQRASRPGGMESRVADAESIGRREQRSDAFWSEERSDAKRLEQRLGSGGVLATPGPTNGLWGNADWLFCRDGKWRPVEPGTFPLAHGAAARVGRLRGYGNAINAEQAAGFVEAVQDVLYPALDLRLNLSEMTTDNAGGIFE